MSGPGRFLMVGEPAGEVCADGVCGPLGAPTDRGDDKPEYLDHDWGTARSAPADAGRKSPSSGG